MTKMIIIDSNSLVLLVLGLMNPALIKDHSRTSIYDEDDFINLITAIKDLESIIVLPNIWTEVDNLLNNFSGGYKDSYVQNIIALIKKTSEQYLATNHVENNGYFFDLGLTDTLILECAKDCSMLITSDSNLSDYARAFGITVYDLKALKNEKFKK